MARHARCAAVLALFLPVLILPLHGAAAKPSLRLATDATPSSETIHLGDSVASLNGPWKFRIGDSPIDPKTNEPLWAQPDFNDSDWETVDLTPPPGSADPISGTSGYSPGWTTRGHRGYAGFAWYRIRIHLESHPATKLALAGPSDVDDIYQVFDNGKFVGDFGEFATNPPQLYTARPETFTLQSSNDTGSSSRVLAFRVWMSANTLNQSDDVGGFHNPPRIGVAHSLAAEQQVKWDELYRAYGGRLIEAIVFGLLGIVALSLVLFDRSDPVYFWIAALALTTAIGNLTISLSVWTEWIPYSVSAVLSDILLYPLVFSGWVMVWRVWFRLRRPTWIPRVLLVLLVLLVISNIFGLNVFFASLPTNVTHAFHVFSLVPRLAIAVLLIATVVQGIREQGPEGWVAVPAVFLAGVSEFSPELGFIHVTQIWFPFGVQLTTRTIANVLLILALSLLLLRRLVLSLRRQRQMALDIKQAQEVQQVILPETHTAVPGFDIESEYRPALEVGGDFFQIIPHATDGSLLIVAGDVAGKGLQAGMLVALLVGAIRTVAQFDPDPRILLDALNRRLLGRGESCATCLALRIASDGDVLLANAGHISPYLNGKPISMEGSLPLGMTSAPDFSILRFPLKPGDRLMLLSDGIAEATDANGNLFGFDRVQALIAEASSATQIANAAQAFGQEDDISVISVTRAAVPELSLA